MHGGAERYHSVWNGLQELEEHGYVFIHDGARPFVDRGIIERAYEEVQEHKACVVGIMFTVFHIEPSTVIRSLK